MQKRQKHINKEIAYFGKVVKNIDIKQNIKNSEFEDKEILFEDIENICYEKDEYFKNNDLLEWIELIENSDLYNAVTRLTEEEQTLLSYLFYKDKTQTEVAKIYNISQSAIFQKFNSIADKIKLFMSKK